jgi:NTP pyrophosphatase (non-canonical NTP hydrolase)
LKEEKIKKAIEAILKSKVMLEIINEDPIDEKRKKETAEEGYSRTETEYKLEQMDYFFENEIEEVLSVPAVFKWLKEELRKDLEGLWESKTAIITAYRDYKSYLHGSRNIVEILDEITKEIRIVYREMLNSEWKGLTVEQVKEKLAKGMTYVALLDEKGNVTREPFIAIANLTTKVTVEIQEEEVSRGPRRGREVKISLDPPIIRKDFTGNESPIKAHIHRIRADEVQTVIIKT